MVQMVHKLNFDKYCIIRKNFNNQSLDNQQGNKVPGEMGSKEAFMNKLGGHLSRMLKGGAPLLWVRG